MVLPPLLSNGPAMTTSEKTSSKASKLRPRRSVLPLGQDAAAPLNGLSPLPDNPRRGFELMKMAGPRLFRIATEGAAALAPR